MRPIGRRAARRASLAGSKFMYQEISGTPVLVAAIPLKECVKFPGIKDGTVFQKNVRQSLGSSNTVNRGIRATIIGDRRSDFFFSPMESLHFATRCSSTETHSRCGDLVS